jgi:hypothetical protein
MKRSLLAVLAAVSIGLGTAGPGMADTAPEDLSSDGRVLYDHIVTQLDALTAPGAELRHGPIAIDETGAGFHVVIPDFAMVMAEGITITYGTLEADMVPEDAGVYAVSMEFPNLLVVSDAAGTEIAHATFGDATYSGTWAPETGGYLDQTARAANIVLTLPDAGMEVRVEAIAYEAALTPSGGSLVSGPSAFSMNGLSLRDGQGNELVNLGSLSGTGAVRDMDRAALLRMNQGIAALGKSDPANQQLDLSFMPGTPGDVLGDASMDMTIENLAVSDPTGGGGLFMGRMTYATGVADLDGPLARLDFRYRHDGLSLTGEASSPLVPDVLNLDLAVERLPATRLYALALAAGALMATVPDAAGPQLLAQLPALFAESGTELKVAALDIAVAGAEAHGSGTVAGDPAASGGVVGGFTLFASGLETAIAALTADPEDQSAQQAGFFLTLFQSLGAPEIAADGAPVLAYRIELDPAGDHKLNGQSIAALFAGMGGEGTTP